MTKQILLCCLFIALGGAALADNPPLIPQALLLQYLAGKGEFALIDARSGEEYEAGHIYGAVNIPQDAELSLAQGLPEALDTPIVMYCRTGRRAASLQQKLATLGYSNVRVLGPAQILWADALPLFNCGVTDSELLSTLAEKTAEKAGDKP